MTVTLVTTSTATGTIPNTATVVGNEAETNALRRFSDQIKEELNIKKITPHDGRKPPRCASCRTSAENASQIGAPAGTGHTVWPPPSVPRSPWRQ